MERTPLFDVQRTDKTLTPWVWPQTSLSNLEMLYRSLCPALWKENAQHKQLALLILQTKCGGSILKWYVTTIQICFIMLAYHQYPHVWHVNFSFCITNTYPFIFQNDQQAGDFLGILLREHNSRVMSSMNEIRHSTQMAMFTFMDDLVECLKKRCICCQLSGMPSCTTAGNINQGFFMPSGNPYFLG